MKISPTLFSLCLFASVTALAAPLVGACGPSGAVMTPEEVAANGTHTFAASPKDTFAATAGALQTLGYMLTVVNEEKGIIKTDRKHLRAQAVYNGNSATAVGFSRQYYIRVQSTDGTNTTVVADPKVFIGERDISGDKVWALEGPEGERELWTRLFAEIQSNL
jgi:hypothetical protein